MRKELGAIAAVAAIMLAGCGQDDKRTIPVADLVAALDQTKSAPSQRVHIDMGMTIPGGEGEVEMSGDGVIDNRTQKGRMKLGLKGDAGTDDDIDEVIHGFTVWMKGKTFSEGLGTDKEWVKMDLQKLGEQQGFDISALAGADPTSQLDQLRAISGDVEVVGDETVRGVPTTRYKATIDLKRYPGVARAADRERVRKSVDRLIELTGSSEVPTEVWIGHDTRRIHKTRSLSQYKQNGQKVEMDLAIELYDFGAPVTGTDPPPPEDVADIQDLQGAAAP